MSKDKQSIEEVLREKGFVVISTAGYSMAPMLRDRRDTVEIHTPTKSPRKYDVVLFKKGDRLVLHRIIKATGDGYIIRGDNAIEKDTVNPEDIIGVLFAFTRNGKRYTATDISYRIYSRFSVFYHPLKITIQRTKGRIKRFIIRTKKK